MATNQTTKHKAKLASKMEADKSIAVHAVKINSISEDGAIATVQIVTPNSDLQSNASIEVRIIGMTPGVYSPLNVSNYTGIMLGDPRGPLGVLLVPKAGVTPNIRHGISKGLQGQTDARPVQPVDRTVKTAPTNTEQTINKESEPYGQMVIIKAPKRLNADHVNTPLIPMGPADLIDLPGAHMGVAEDEVRLIADVSNGIVITGRNGVNISGPVSLSTSLENIRFGGGWRANPMMQYQIPSTAVTPIPTMLCDFPGKDMLRGFESYMTDLL